MPLSPPSWAGALSAAFVAALPVDHAAVSTLGRPFEVRTVCSSDTVAAALDRLQLDERMGPMWQARIRRAPAMVPDLRVAASGHWPAFTAAAQSRGIRSVFAFPMRVGTVDVGVASLYARTVFAFAEEHVAEARLLASAAASEILDTALTHAGAEAPTPDPMRHALQKVVAQLRVSHASAMLIIRTHAYVTRRPVHEVAQGVTEGTIDVTD